MLRASRDYCTFKRFHRNVFPKPYGYGKPLMESTTWTFNQRIDSFAKLIDNVDHSCCWYNGYERE